MTEKERSDYIVQKLFLETEIQLFEEWYCIQYQKTSLRKVRQAAFRKEMENRLSRITPLAIPVEVFNILEMIEKEVSGF